MTAGLSDIELAGFERDGFFGPFDVYDKAYLTEEVRRLRVALFDRSHAVYNSHSAGNIANYDRHLDVSFLDSHIRQAPILDRVKSILGEDIVCWRTEFFVKYPGDEGTDWHQSRTLAIGGGTPPLVATETLERFKDVFLTLSVWTAFTDSNISNGCLQVIPGSHLEQNYDETKRMNWAPQSTNTIYKNGLKKGFFGYDTRDIQRDPKWSPAEDRARNLEVAAGQSVILWEATMHGSLPNTTTSNTRMAFVARYVPPHVRIYPGMTTLREFGGVADLSKWRSILVSGVDNHGYNKK